MSAITDYTAMESIENGVHVETYKASGIDTTPEAREEAFQIASSLGLELQSKAYSSEDAMLEWPLAPGELVALYCVCFPKNTPIEKYSQPIPMSVLREVEKVRKLCDDPTNDYFLESIIIRSPSTAASPDPVLFANIRKADEHSFQAKPHMVARWGSALLPIDELYTIAKQRVVDSLVAKKAMIETEISIIQQSSKPRFSHRLSSWDTTEDVTKQHESAILV